MCEGGFDGVLNVWRECVVCVENIYLGVDASCRVWSAYIYSGDILFLFCEAKLSLKTCHV